MAICANVVLFTAKTLRTLSLSLLEGSIVKFHHPAMDHESEAVIVPL
jgi:hypothetical protein